MKILDLFKTKRTENETTPSIDISMLSALFEIDTIDRRKAMNIPKVAQSVHLISDIIAMLPIYLYKEINKTTIEIKNDIRVKLLNDETGDTLDAFQFKKAICMDYLIDGNAYIYMNRIRNEVKSLHYVENNYISILKNTNPIFKDYDILVQGKNYLPFDFINITRGSRDGIVGKGILEENSEVLKTAYTTLIYELSLLQDGGNKKGFLKSSNKLSEEAMKKLKIAWNNLYKNNEDKIVILNNGLEFQEASQTSVEMQLNEKKKTLDEQIANIFNIDTTNFENTIKYAIMPITKAIECALNKSLLLEEEKGSFYFATDVSEMLKGAIKERFEAYQLAVKNGIMTRNEIRYKEDLEEIKGLDTITLNLADVIFDIETQTYFTPNTKLVENLSDEKGGGENEGQD